MKETSKIIIDAKAPRMGKKDFSIRLFNKELYQKFLTQHPEYENLSWQEFQSLWADLTETIRSEGVINPLGVKLGCYLGELKTQYLPYKFENTDPKTSNELGEKVKHLNITTRGKTAKVKWERRWAVKFNNILQFYAFEPDKKMCLLAKKHILEHPEKLRVSRNTLGGKRKWK